MEIFLTLLISFIQSYYPANTHTPQSFEDKGYTIISSEYDPAGYLIEATDLKGDTVNIITFTTDNYFTITKA